MIVENAPAIRLAVCPAKLITFTNSLTTGSINRSLYCLNPLTTLIKVASALEISPKAPLPVLHFFARPIILFFSSLLSNP